jgi:Ca2+-binding RTX toxin-like protein
MTQAPTVSKSPAWATARATRRRTPDVERFSFDDGALTAGELAARPRLLTRFRLDGDAGAAQDSGPVGAFGILQGDATLGASGPGVNAGPLSLEGAGDYLEIAEDPAYQLDAGSLTIWANRNGSSGAQAVLSRDSRNFDDGGHLTISITRNGAVEVRHQSDSDSLFLRSANGVVPAGDWTQIGYSWSEAGVTLYVNGVAHDSSATARTIAGAPQLWTIGASQIRSGDGVADNLESFFDGRIADFSLFSGALSAEDFARGYVETASGVGGAGDDLIVGESSADNLEGREGRDRIEGGAGDDVLIGGGDRDTLFGGDGDDILQGGDGRDLLFGGAGGDTLDGGRAADVMDGGAGGDTDMLHHQDGGRSNTIIDSGTDGLDAVVLDSGDSGDGQTFRIQGEFSARSTGVEVIDGRGVTGEFLGTNDAAADFDFSEITLLNVDLIGGTDAADTVIGSAGGDRIDGGAGADTLAGGDGSDVLLVAFGAGDDVQRGRHGGGSLDSSR